MTHHPPRERDASTTGSLWRPLALLLLLCAVLYLPGFAALPVTDRDEARFAQATRQMLETHDFLDIRFGTEARDNKPAGIYWLQAAAVAAASTAASDAIWPYRLPSLLGATGAVLLTFAFGIALVGRAAALAGAALLAASIALASEAHLAKTDAVLLCLSVAAEGALARLYLGQHRGPAPVRWAVLFWLAQSAAILVKGPVTPALSLLTVAALAIADRDARWLRDLRPLYGLALVVAVVGPWLVAITLATKGAFLEQSVGRDFLGKVVGAQESHGAWPGTYLALIWVTFWPGSLLLAAAGALAWRERRDPAVRFLAAWAVPFWIALELVPTKLPHYLLPVFPALALMAGRVLYVAAAVPRWAWRCGATLWATASLIVAVTLVAAPLKLEGGIDWAGLVAALVIVICGAGTFARCWRAPGPALAPYAILLAVVTIPAALAVEAPRLEALWLSRAAAGLVARDAPGARVVAVGYSEPSLVFLLGTDTVLAGPGAAADRMRSPGWVALVESRDEAALADALARAGLRPQSLGRVIGLDYSNGKRMVLTLERAAPLSGAR